jgi:uridylate kinase
VVYSDDPNINKEAVKYDHLSFDEAITKNLKVMDQTSLCFCRDNNLSVRVFNADSEGAILEAIVNENTNIGTLVELEKSLTILLKTQTKA